MADEDAIDNLPVTQVLVLEVLAARWRLGERIWTLTRTTRQALDALEALGLVGYKGGIVERTYLAWLTKAGREAMLDSQYQAPGPLRPDCPQCAGVKTALDALHQQDKHEEANRGQ